MTEPPPGDPGPDHPGPDHPGTDAGAGTETAPPDRPTRNRTARFAWTAVIIIVVVVVAVVVDALTSAPPEQSARRLTVTSASVVSDLSTVPAATFDAVGVTVTGTALTAPTVLQGQPPLRSAGKPEVLYVGAEFCPFCAAERWPLIVALARFGHFTTLHNMQSAPNSVFSGIQTFSFAGAAYTSPYVSFVGLELYSNVADTDGTFTRIARLTPTQAAVVSRYATEAGQGSGTSTGTFPFVDVENRLVTSTSAFSPALIVGQSQSAIAGALSQATTPVGPTAAPIGQAVVAAANQLTAGICASTDQQPRPVCQSKGVRTAAQSLGLA